MTPTGIANTGSGLVLLTRDMAKLGQLYLDQGRWNGNQIVPQEWVERSISHSATYRDEYTTGYGYQWWLGEFTNGDSKVPFYSSRGTGGQFICVIPRYNMVIAFTTQNYNDRELSYLPFSLLEKYILPSILD